MKILIVNTGSASKKYALYEEGKKIYHAHFEMEPASPAGGEGGYIVTEIYEEISQKTPVSERVFERALYRLIDSLIEKKIISSTKDIGAIGIRIVAPGEYFLAHRVIDKEYLKLAKKAVKKVPLHLGPALEEIKLLGKIFDKTKIIGVSDSAFHHDLPTKAKYYAVPISDSRKLGLQKFGYHGLSIQSVISQVEKKLGKLPTKTVVCHLGGGASITAVKDGKSMDTSMGFTPLDGLVMATRVGDIDPGAAIYLQEELGLNTRKLGEYFNNKCGLLGLSGKSSDIRELLKFEKDGDKDSALALEIYVHRLQKHIGSAIIILGGLDLLIFAGTVGERSFIMRERICSNLRFLGLDLNKIENDKSEGIEAEISTLESKVKVLVVKTDEMEQIAQDTVKVLNS